MFSLMDKVLKHNDEVVNIINRANLPITYISLIWSTKDTTTTFIIDIKDHTNTSLQILSIGPSPFPNSKNVYEIFLSPYIQSPSTRLLRFILTIDPPSKYLQIYSIMVS
jgi:hypothetical protein